MEITILHESTMFQYTFTVTNMEDLQNQIASQIKLDPKKFLLFEYRVGETTEKKITSIDQLRNGIIVIVVPNDYIVDHSDQFINVSQFFDKSKFESSFQVLSLLNSKKGQSNINHKDKKIDIDNKKGSNTESITDTTPHEKEKFLLSEIASNIRNRKLQDIENEKQIEDNLKQVEE